MTGKLKLQLLLGFFLVGLVYGKPYNGTAKAQYTGYRAFKIFLKEGCQVKSLRTFERISKSIIINNGIPAENQTVTVIVAPHRLNEFKHYLASHKIYSKLLTNDLEQTLSSVNQTYLNLTTYNTFEDINHWLDSLEKSFPNIVTVSNYGTSFNKNPLRYIKISYPRYTSRRAVFIEAGMNGNEWIAPATALYIIHELLMTRIASVRAVARSYDWYIIPITNPDGYIHSHNVDRLWRKTRKPYNTTSFGANMNLNWDYDWNGPGSSNKTCSVNYAGPKPHSEIETAALAKFVRKLNNAVVFISLHSFGQTLSYPREVDLYDAQDMVDNLSTHLGHICASAIGALEKRYGTRYSCGGGMRSLYQHSGTFTDWLYVARLAKFAFSYHLRPHRRNFRTGYQLEESQIIPTAEETLDSILTIVNEASRLNFLEPVPVVVNTTAKAHIIHDELF